MGKYCDIMLPKNTTQGKKLTSSHKKSFKKNEIDECAKTPTASIC